MVGLARAREILRLRVHGCHIADKQRAGTLFGRVSRVPQGCHKKGDPPLPSLFREGVLSLFSPYSVHSACGIKLSLELKLALAVKNSLENLLLPMILCIVFDDVLRKIL